MNEKIYQFLLRSLENSSQAVFFFDKKESKSFHANKIALEHFDIGNGQVDLESVFSSKDLPDFLHDEFTQQLSVGDFAMAYDVPVIRKDGVLRNCDMQVAYADEEKHNLFIELYFKTDIRMEKAMAQVEQSSRAEAILEFDESFTTLFCNQAFHDVFESDETLRYSHYSNVLGNCFVKEEKSSILAEIHEALCKSRHFYKKLKICTTKNKALWYSLEFQRRTLDHSGTDKIMVYMVNIEQEMELESKLADVNQYFNILQSMCKGLLYRFDIHTRTLYRNQETARVYKVPEVTENFPPQEWLDSVMHPEDIEDYKDYIDRVVDGVEGAHISRLKNPDGELQYHKFTFKALRNPDGSVKEMVGCAMNIHHLRETQKQLADVTQYFNILQTMTKGLLFRLDIHKKIMYRSSETAKFYGVSPVAVNYPNTEGLKALFHAADIEGYVQFIDYIYTGGEGTHQSRLFSPSGNYEYHQITFRALRDDKGNVREMIGTAINIQHLKNTEDELSNVNQYFQILQSFTKDLLYRLDIKKRVLYRNENTSAYYGIPPVVENYPCFETLQGVFHPDDIQNYVKFIETVMKGQAGTHTARHIAPSGTFEYHKFTFKPLVNTDGTISEMIGNAVNIHTLMELETKATFDMLTNCLNKISFQEQVKHILSHASLEDFHAMIFIDLDDFKGINDNLGHSFGDYLLQTVGGRLKNLVREMDLVGRVGGDEFVVFLHSCNHLNLEERGIQILEALRKEYLQNTTAATIKGSVGIATYPAHGTTYEELYENADKALYHSKSLGKDVSTIYYKGL